MPRWRNADYYHTGQGNKYLPSWRAASSTTGRTCNTVLEQTPLSCASSPPSRSSETSRPSTKWVRSFPPAPQHPLTWDSFWSQTSTELKVKEPLGLKDTAASEAGTEARHPELRKIQTSRTEPLIGGVLTNTSGEMPASSLRRGLRLVCAWRYLNWLKGEPDGSKDGCEWNEWAGLQLTRGGAMGFLGLGPRNCRRSHTYSQDPQCPRKVLGFRGKRSLEFPGLFNSLFSHKNQSLSDCFPQRFKGGT